MIGDMTCGNSDVFQGLLQDGTELIDYGGGLSFLFTCAVPASDP